MLGLRFPRPKRSPWELLRSALFSCALVLISQFALASVPWLFPSISLLAMLPIAALVMAVTIFLGRFWRRLFDVSASAPALVLFNLLFMWGVYITVIRKAVPSLLDAVLNAECALLLYGLYRIFSSDPGAVSFSSSTVESGQNEFDTLNVQFENSPTLSRVRYCKNCKTGIKGFDHHCPAFGNCIGHKNHRLFIILLAGFLIAESSYTMSSTKFLTKSADAQRMESVASSGCFKFGLRPVGGEEREGGSSGHIEGFADGDQGAGEGGADYVVQHLLTLLAPPYNAPGEHHLHLIGGDLPGAPSLDMPRDLGSDR